MWSCGSCSEYRKTQTMILALSAADIPTLLSFHPTPRSLPSSSIFSANVSIATEFGLLYIDRAFADVAPSPSPSLLLHVVKQDSLICTVLAYAVRAY